MLVPLLVRCNFDLFKCWCFMLLLRNIIFTDDAGKIIFQCNLFCKDHLFRTFGKRKCGFLYGDIPVSFHRSNICFLYPRLLSFVDFRKQDIAALFSSFFPTLSSSILMTTDPTLLAHMKPVGIETFTVMSCGLITQLLKELFNDILWRWGITTTDVFIKAPTLGRLPSKAKDSNLAMRYGYALLNTNPIFQYYMVINKKNVSYRYYYCSYGEKPVGDLSGWGNFHLVNICPSGMCLAG